MQPALLSCCFSPRATYIYMTHQINSTRSGTLQPTYEVPKYNGWIGWKGSKGTTSTEPTAVATNRYIAQRHSSLFFHLLLLLLLCLPAREPILGIHCCWWWCVPVAHSRVSAVFCCFRSIFLPSAAEEAATSGAHASMCPRGTAGCG